MTPTCPRCGSDAAVTWTTDAAGTHYTCRFSHNGEGAVTWTVAAPAKKSAARATGTRTTTSRATTTRTATTRSTAPRSSTSARPSAPAAPRVTMSVNDRGIAAVVKEVTERGGQARVVQDGNRREVVVTGPGGEGEVRLVVRARTAGDWQTRASYGTPMAEDEHPRAFWVLVHLGPGPAVRSYVVPEWWMLNDISEKHDEYLAFRSGTRPVNPDSDHHSIATNRVEQWLERWDQIPVLPSPAGAVTDADSDGPANDVDLA
ncbi:MAG: hypothetical protein ACTHMS_14280 [Jatrophihabitans sp.]|uniref:hypothetical protein n=1 Tax=Jatrophihabitans sp. TaxID=1932789 RepID=UPI003F7EA4D4